MLESDLRKDFVFRESGIFLIINRQIVPLRKRLTTLGRHLENDIVFQEAFLSRFHAEIVNEDGVYVLYDKQSTSGTFVNSRRIERCILNSGDLISLANISIMFVDNNRKIAQRSLGTTQTLHITPPAGEEGPHE